MSTLPEQFSAARKAQIEAQLDVFRNFSSRAVENTEKLIALNLSTTRATVEKSSATVRQLMSARDPRDLFALATHGRENLDTMFAYSRALFGIAASVRSEQARGPASLLAAPFAAREQVEQAAEDTAELAGEVADEVEAGASRLLHSVPAADPLPLGEANPIAKAVASIAVSAAPDTPAAAPFDSDSEENAVEVSGLKPVDATPPPAKPALVKQADIASSKGGRKK